MMESIISKKLTIIIIILILIFGGIYFIDLWESEEQFKPGSGISYIIDDGSSCEEIFNNTPNWTFMSRHTYNESYCERHKREHCYIPIKDDMDINMEDFCKYEGIVYVYGAD